MVALDALDMKTGRILDPTVPRKTLQQAFRRRHPNYILVLTPPTFSVYTRPPPFDTDHYVEELKITGRTSVPYTNGNVRRVFNRARYLLTQHKISIRRPTKYECQDFVSFKAIPK